MEGASALQENSPNSPCIVYGMLSAENEVIPKLPLDSGVQINLETKNSSYSECKALFNIPHDGNSESEKDIRPIRKLPSESSDYVNGEFEKEILIQHSTDEVFLKSNLNSTVKSDENGISDLDSSTGVGKASSGYCTDTSEKEEFATDEHNAHKVIKPLCSENCLPLTSCSAVNEVEAAKSSANTSSSSPRNTRSRSYSLRSRSKCTTTTEVADFHEDLLPFDMEQLLHCDYKPVTSEEIYLRKLIQQLDSSYTKAVVLVTRLENMDPSLWRKYLSNQK